MAKQQKPKNPQTAQLQKQTLTENEPASAAAQPQLPPPNERPH